MPPTEKDAGSGLATLYVGDLSPDVTELHLQETFAPYGPVAMIHVCRDSMTRRSLGYAYVNYYNNADAQMAMDKLNYTEIRGRCCRIMWNNRDRKVRASAEANIFVKNLDPNVNSRSLYETFGIFGNIISCKVASDPDGTSRGYGFVQYESEDAAKQAIERVNGQTIGTGNRTVYVGPVIKQDRQIQGSDCALYVRNVPADWDDVKVNELFKPFGELASTLILNDGKSQRNYGFVNFKDADCAQKAIEALHGKDLRTDEEKAQMEKEEEEKKAKAEEDKKARAEEAGEAGEEKKEEEANVKAEKDAEDDDEKKDGWRAVPTYCLFVGRSKTRAERDEEAQKRNDARQGFEGIKLCVRNLPAETTDSSLKALFLEFGTVTDVKSVLDRETGQCKGYGFVRFSTMEEATKAVAEMHLKEAPSGHVLQVDLAGGKGEGKGGGKGDFKGGKGKGKGGGYGGGYGGYGGYGKGGMQGQMQGKGGMMGMPMQGGYPPAMYYPMMGMPGMPGGPGAQMPRPMMGMPAGMMPMMMPGMPGMQMMRPAMPQQQQQRPGMPPGQ